MQKLILKYYNPVLKIVLGNWNQVFHIPEEGGSPIALSPEYYKGCLVFRLPKSSKRISYKAIRSYLEYKITTVFIEEIKLPF